MPFIFIPIFLIFLTIAILFMRHSVINSGGWIYLEEKYKTKQSPTELSSENLKISSCSLEGLQIQNLIKFHKTPKGLLLVPSRLIKNREINILVPWSEIVECRKRKNFLQKTVRIIIGDPFVSFIDLNEKDFEKIRLEIERNFRRRNF